MTNMPKLIIFDLDDTLISWDAVAGELWRRACRETCHGEPYDVDLLAERIRRAGHWYWSDPERHRRGRLDLYETRRAVARHAFAELGIARPDLVDRIADAYSRIREDEAFLIPGAAETLAGLKRRGIRLALLTNGESHLQRAKIERFGLAPYFERIVIEGEFGAGKPDPDGFLHLLGDLGVAAADAWMVGNDLARDIAPCRELSIFSVWVDAAGEGLPESTGIAPDRTVKSVVEVPGLLDAV